MEPSDKEILQHARALKPYAKNPFESFGFTMLMLFCYPFYFIPYEWEIYLANTNPAKRYMEACSRWQTIAVCWCIAILCLLFEDFESIAGTVSYIIVKFCLVTTFSLYVFVIFVFGFMIDVISLRYEDRMVVFALNYKFIMGITIPIFALATVQLTVAIIAFIFGVFYESHSWICYTTTLFAFGAQCCWFATYAIFVKDAWVPIQQAYDELKSSQNLVED